DRWRWSRPAMAATAATAALVAWEAVDRIGTGSGSFPRPATYRAVDSRGYTPHGPVGTRDGVRRPCPLARGEHPRRGALSRSVPSYPGVLALSGPPKKGSPAWR